MSIAQRFIAGNTMNEETSPVRDDRLSSLTGLKTIDLSQLNDKSLGYYRVSLAGQKFRQKNQDSTNFFVLYSKAA
jgi:hypothetical protein